MTISSYLLIINIKSSSSRYSFNVSNTQRSRFAYKFLSGRVFNIIGKANMFTNNLQTYCGNDNIICCYSRIYTIERRQWDFKQKQIKVEFGVDTLALGLILLSWYKSAMFTKSLFSNKTLRYRRLNINNL